MGGLILPVLTPAAGMRIGRNSAVKWTAIADDRRSSTKFRERESRTGELAWQQHWQLCRPLQTDRRTPGSA